MKNWLFLVFMSLHSFLRSKTSLSYKSPELEWTCASFLTLTTLTFSHIRYCLYLIVWNKCFVNYSLQFFFMFYLCKQYILFIYTSIVLRNIFYTYLEKMKKIVLICKQEIRSSKIMIKHDISVGIMKFNSWQIDSLFLPSFFAPSLFSWWLDLRSTIWMQSWFDTRRGSYPFFKKLHGGFIIIPLSTLLIYYLHNIYFVGDKVFYSCKKENRK